jgi:flagellar hook-associated protein 2
MEEAAMTMRVTGLTSGLDTESIISALVSAYELKTQKYTKAQTKLTWTQDAWKSLNTKVYSLYTNISNLRFSSAYSLKKTTVSDSTKATVTADTDAVNGTQKMKIKSMAQTAYMTGGKLTSTSGKSVTEDSTLASLGYQGISGSDGSTSSSVRTSIKLTQADGTETSINVDGNTTIKELVSSLKEAGLNASFDSTQQRLYISSKTAGAAGDFEFSALENDSNSASALSVLGLSTSYPDDKTYEELSDDEKDNYAKKLDGTDAEITLNGVRYTSETNNFAINGLNITVTGVTGEDEITLTTDTDSQGIYDKIKDFLTEYNSVINEMTKLYNADSSYGYDPLTDDEKDAMSDTEIEKWETKIKDSLLRNDTTLNSVMMSMINTMSSTYEVNGTKMSLSTLGISTLGYLNAAENENYAYHIDGDSDDENTSGNTDKLMAAIKSDPDSVISFMKQLSSTLYTKLGDKMKSTTLSSAYTIYNDKEMNSQYSEYSKTISNWEDKLSDKEDYYYEKFASMESALSTLQSQTSSLTSMFSS